jgi:hypothetical protein
MKPRGFIVALVCAVISAAAVTHAQDKEKAASGSEIEDPSAGARFQWGPLKFTPGIAITNVGIDNNVFNDPDHKFQDTTAAVGPAVNAWTALGRLRVAAKSSGQYLYFKEFDSQRSWNTAHTLRLDLPLNRIRPFAEGSYVNTRDRPGYEIDSRARASTNGVTLGSQLVLSGKTTAVLSVSRSTIAFDQHETFLGSELAASLNHYTDGEAAQLRYRLTPLTTLLMSADAMQDRFDHDRLRNTDSFSVRSGFEFKPHALISGTVTAGFRHFNVLSDVVPDYHGPVAAVDAKYLLTTSTQLKARVNRDIQFSFDELTPYYTLSDSGLTITQRIATSWDVIAAGSMQSLAYRSVKLAPVSSARTDRSQVVSLGVGYLVGDTMRIGFDVNYYARQSKIADRNYDGFRAGASVTYGIQR